MFCKLRHGILLLLILLVWALVACFYWNGLDAKLYAHHEAIVGDLLITDKEGNKVSREVREYLINGEYVERWYEQFFLIVAVPIAGMIMVLCLMMSQAVSHISRGNGAHTQKRRDESGKE